MVIMEVPSIDCAAFRNLLEAGALVLDCRSFFSFNSSHIPGSTNVRFSTIVRRRARGGLGLEHIVPNEEARCRLLSGQCRAVVFLDERSADFEQVKKDSTLMLAVAALRRDPCGASVFLLRDSVRNSGGRVFVHCQAGISRSATICLAYLMRTNRVKLDEAFEFVKQRRSIISLSLPPSLPWTTSQSGFEAFSSEFPELCTKPAAPQGLCLPLSSSCPPGSAESGCSSCGTPLYDQGGPVEILPFLYLGSAYHASRKDMLDTLGITALINVSANCPNHFEGHYQYKSIPVEDNHKADISSWFNEAIEFIDSVRNSGGRVFVHCQAGISRSATICLAYLMRTNRVKLDEAFEFVKQRRSIISPNFSFMGQLLQFESQVLAPSSCSAEVGSPALGSTGTVFNFPVSIPVCSSSSPLTFLHSPITTSPSC
ncbi:DUS1 phosphatase, partial [Atractosteus spatula]|nr:DUS1 phosphatase [Atractosteus spatula]